MEEHFNKHQERFYKDLLEKGIKPLRPLLYARPVHSQFVLLSFFNEGDERILQFLKKHLGIKDMDSVLFVMRQPPWSKKRSNDLFWNARGYVRLFLERLYGKDLALAPLRLTQIVNLDFREKATLEHLYLYLPDKEALSRLYKFYDNQQEFFKALESTYISKILSEVRIRVIVNTAQGSLTFRDLSEGEQQLLMVLGLLRFTKEDESLFLLDEPDTHLNPVWSIQYLDFLYEIMGEQATSHIIMTTHNPLVISSLERSQVKIMQREEKTGQITAETPYENPKGMGVAAILTSDLFGLRSTLDIPTQRLLDRRRELAVKDDLDVQERRELHILNEQLEGLDFSITMPDPLYKDFVLEMTRNEDPLIRKSIELSSEQREQQRDLTHRIVSKLRQEQEDEE
jgi:ABC-type multidrug transport system ATPase subunit